MTEEEVGSSRYRDIHDELEFHRHAAVEDLIEEGWAPESARREAARRFGNWEAHIAGLERLRQSQHKRQRRRLIMIGWLDILRSTVRGARRRIRLSLAVVILMGLGLGATAIWMWPAPLAVNMRVKPELLRLAPLTVYAAPALTPSRVPELSVPYERTRSEWNVGDGVEHAYRWRSSEDVYGVLPSW